MVVTNEMIEAGCAAIVQGRGYVWPDGFLDDELKTGRENMRIALTAALAVAPEVEVKPLEWVKSHMTGWNDDWHTTAPLIYTIRCADENGWKWCGAGAFGYAPTPEAAKSAAQADYTARIMSALATTETNGHPFTDGDHK